MRRRIRRAGTWLGVLGVTVSFLGILVAVVSAPWFAWGANALSDLGVPGRASAPAFNYALIAGGLFGMGFVVRLWVTVSGIVLRVGLVVFGVAFGCLSLVGAFPSPTAYHLPVAVGFFLSFTYGLFVYGTGEVVSGRVRAGLGSIWLGIAHVTAWIAWLVAGANGVAVPEAVGAILLAVWVGAVTRRLQRTGDA